MDHGRFVEEVMQRTGIQRPEDARRAIDAALETLGERLVGIASGAVARGLPGEVAQALRRHPYEGELELSEVYRRVAEREGVSYGFAIEHAQVVFQVLGEAVDEEGHRHITRHLPAEFLELFAPRQTSAAPASPRREAAPPSRERDSGENIANGRMGSRRPLSTGRPDRAHSDSVARTDNPHADSKLSTTRGTAAERRGDTIAEGKPGSHRPLSEGGHD